jgi:DNA-binding NtrC family response regulator
MTSSKRSILYLDDESICLDVFHHTFSEEYDVRIAKTIAEARQAMAEHSSDILISDQTMPDTSGIDFLREAAIAYPSSVRVLLTGSMCCGEALREISTGTVNMFVTKPWNEEDMSKVLLRASLEANRNVSS